MNVPRFDRVYLVGYMDINWTELSFFLDDHGIPDWESDTDDPCQVLPEIAGRLCYMSYGKSRPGGNAAYLNHLIKMGHTSVLEHVQFNFIITGISRSCTHELVRHRIGVGYSQQSQRYVEAKPEFVEPPVIANDPELHEIWTGAVQESHRVYSLLIAALKNKFAHIEDKTIRRKRLLETARSVLPNATETKIFVTMNARALRHFFEMRGSIHADLEIRSLAVEMFQLVKESFPNLFPDMEIVTDKDKELSIRISGVSE